MQQTAAKAPTNIQDIRGCRKLNNVLLAHVGVLKAYQTEAKRAERRGTFVVSVKNKLSQSHRRRLLPTTFMRDMVSSSTLAYTLQLVNGHSSTIHQGPGSELQDLRFVCSHMVRPFFAGHKITILAYLRDLTFLERKGCVIGSLIIPESSFGSSVTLVSGSE